MFFHKTKIATDDSLLQLSIDEKRRTPAYINLCPNKFTYHFSNPRQSLSRRESNWAILLDVSKHDRCWRDYSLDPRPSMSYRHSRLHKLSPKDELQGPIPPLLCDPGNGSTSQNAIAWWFILDNNFLSNTEHSENIPEWELLLVQFCRSQESTQNPSVGLNWRPFATVQNKLFYFSSKNTNLAVCGPHQDLSLTQRYCPYRRRISQQCTRWDAGTETASCDLVRFETTTKRLIPETNNTVFTTSNKTLARKRN